MQTRKTQTDYKLTLDFRDYMYLLEEYKASEHFRKIFPEAFTEEELMTTDRRKSEELFNQNRDDPYLEFANYAAQKYGFDRATSIRFLSTSMKQELCVFKREPPIWK